MSPTRSTAAHGSVAYLRIHGFSQQPVTEQARLKARLDDTLAAALPPLESHERIVAEAPEGIAVVVLANPLGALHLAWRVGADGALPLAVGLAHGAVRVAQGAQPAIYGDAIATAEALSRSALPGGACASRDFRDALAQPSPGAARRLARAGTAVDAQDRALETYRADRASYTRSGRRFFAVAGGIAAAIVMVGIALRFTGAERPPVVAAKPSVPAHAPTSPKPTRPVTPATLTFDIRPEGEIWVNGQVKGKSPPLRKIQLPPGSHSIEIRYGKHRPMATELVVAEGEELSVQHNFISKQPAKPVWQRWIDKVK